MYYQGLHADIIVADDLGGLLTPPSQDNVDFDTCKGIIYTGKYWPRANEKIDRVWRPISEVWPSHPRRGHLHIFVCLPAS